MTEKTCSCGSAKPRRELVDARGIFCCFICEKCEEEKRASYRPEIFTDSQYWTDGPIYEKQKHVSALIEPLTAYANNCKVDNEVKMWADIRAHFCYRFRQSQHAKTMIEDDFDSLTGAALYNLSEAMRLAEFMIGAQAAIDLLHACTSYMTFYSYVLERLPARIVRELLQKDMDGIIQQRLAVRETNHRLAHD